MAKKKIICFDIDNVICKTINSDYINSLPLTENINFINKLYNYGHYIKLFTARFMGRNKENVILAKKQGYLITKKQLILWNVQYHELIFGKPSYDIFVDDKNIEINTNWQKKLLKNLKN